MTQDQGLAGPTLIPCQFRQPGLGLRTQIELRNLVPVANSLEFQSNIRATKYNFGVMWHKTIRSQLRPISLALLH